MNGDEALTQLMRAIGEDDDFDPRSLGLAFERAGDASFDAVVRHLDEPQTSDAGRMRGLRLLALLGRQFCVPRKPEVLAICMRLTKHPHVGVRSAAVNTGIYTFRSIRHLKLLAPETLAATEEQLRAAVHRALEAGIASEQGELARRFVVAEDDGFELPDEDATRE